MKNLILPIACCVIFITGLGEARGYNFVLTKESYNCVAYTSNIFSGEDYDEGVLSASASSRYELGDFDDFGHLWGCWSYADAFINPDHTQKVLSATYSIRGSGSSNIIDIGWYSSASVVGSLSFYIAKEVHDISNTALLMLDSTGISLNNTKFPAGTVPISLNTLDTNKLNFSLRGDDIDFSAQGRFALSFVPAPVPSSIIFFGSGLILTAAFGNMRRKG